MQTYRKIHRLLLGAFAVAVFVAIGASPALAVKPSGESGGAGACPKSPVGFLEAKNVGASFTPGNPTEYKFESFVDEHPVGGVPGLVKYCVYTNSSAAPDPVTVAAVGDNGEAWLARTSKKSGNFSFARPGGNKSNIGLDGEDHPMGTATWSALPTNQEILLHINDPTQCHEVYGEGTPETCFVTPTERPGPVCDEGQGTTDGYAYNSIPLDFPECTPPPSFAFEGNFASEFGDMVEPGEGGEIDEMIVDFQSYGCSLKGHWNTGDCVTEAPGPSTFTIPGGITASIYNDNGSGEPQYPAAATATIGENELAIPFRPSADPSCTGENAGKFIGPAGVCVNSQPVLLHFHFASGHFLNERVFWTVQFRTSNAGYPPIGNETECRKEETTPGCGYDNLNVGTWTYPGSTYAGKDVADTTWADFGIVEPGNLEEIELEEPPLTGADLRPLGQIKVK